MLQNNTKKIRLLIIAVLSLIITLFSFTLLSPAQAENKVVVNIFHGEGCPHCAKEISYITKLLGDPKYSEKVQLYKYEVYYNQENANLFVGYLEKNRIDNIGVPFTIVCDQVFVGYGSDDTTGVQIKNAIDQKLNNGCFDSLKQYQETLTKPNSDISATSSATTTKPTGTTTSTSTASSTDSNATTTSTSTNPAVTTSGDTSPIYFDAPLLGKVNLKDLSLPIATFLIALADGFNPCAMWILIFLISMLINMKDRKKLYILGSTFIFVSGLVYFVFLAAWFNFFKFIGYVYWIKVIIGIVAIVTGVLHIKDAMKNKAECKVTNTDQKKSIMERVKKAINEKSFVLAIIGISILAVSVNLIEVVCSAGLPAVYTNLLSTVHLSTAEYYMYLIFYTLIFMLDDLLIFFIAVKTMHLTGATQKYAKWSSLIGGIVILILGLLLIFKPEVLMFGQ